MNKKRYIMPKTVVHHLDAAPLMLASSISQSTPNGYSNDGWDDRMVVRNLFGITDLMGKDCSGNIHTADPGSAQRNGFYAVFHIIG